MRRLEILGVEVVLGERLPLPPIEEDKPGEMKKMKLKDGREIEYDYLVRSISSSFSLRFAHLSFPLPADALHGSKAQLGALPQLPPRNSRRARLHHHPPYSASRRRASTGLRGAEREDPSQHLRHRRRTSASCPAHRRLVLTSFFSSGRQRRCHQGWSHRLEPGRCCRSEHHVLRRDGSPQRCSRSGRARESTGARSVREEPASNQGFPRTRTSRFVLLLFLLLTLFGPSSMQADSVSELLPSMDAKETIIQPGSFSFSPFLDPLRSSPSPSTATNGPVDGYYEMVWRRMGTESIDITL